MPREVLSADETDLNALATFAADTTRPFSSSAEFE
jgi:hypothetical protein